MNVLILLFFDVFSMVRQKHALNMVAQNMVAIGQFFVFCVASDPIDHVLMCVSVCCVGVITIQWFFWGYSLAFSEGNEIIG